MATRRQTVTAIATACTGYRTYMIAKGSLGTTSRPVVYWDSVGLEQKTGFPYRW